MIPINWTPDRKTLAEFSEAGMFALGMVAAPLAYFRGQPRARRGLLGRWPWLGRLVGLVRPGWLRPAFLGLTLATWPIGWVVSRLALGLLYFAGLHADRPDLPPDRPRRPAAARSTAAAKTYWEPYRPDRGLERYLRPF